MYMLPVAVAWVSPSDCKVPLLAKRRKHAQVIIHHARARLLDTQYHFILSFLFSYYSEL